MQIGNSLFINELFLHYSLQFSINNKKMKRTQIFWIAILVALVSSCGNTLNKLSTSSTGRNGEVLIVSERDLWRGDLKDTITNYLTDFQYGLPQTEPKFTVFSTPMDEFNRILRPHRSILMISLDKSLPEAKVNFIKDKWATPQVMIKLMGPTRESIIQKFWEQREAIADMFIESEYRRYQKIADNMGELGVTKQLEDKYGYSLKFPKGFSISKMNESFCWIRKEAKDFSHGILVYSYDYTDAKMLDAKNILYIRDTLTKAQIPGPTDSSYMAVSYKVYKPESRVIDFLGNYCVETRGLWLVENDFMGGPFVNYTFVDKASNKVISLDGYIYAPRDNKRDMLRSVEAILHTWKTVPKAVVAKK